MKKVFLIQVLCLLVLVLGVLLLDRKHYHVFYETRRSIVEISLSVQDCAPQGPQGDVQNIGGKLRQENAKDRYPCAVQKQSVQQRAKHGGESIAREIRPGGVEEKGNGIFSRPKYQGVYRPPDYAAQQEEKSGSAAAGCGRRTASEKNGTRFSGFSSGGQLPVPPALLPKGKHTPPYSAYVLPV